MALDKIDIYYTVKKNQTLSGIALELFGSSNKYDKIYKEDGSVIVNKCLIRAGQRLMVHDVARVRALDKDYITPLRNRDKAGGDKVDALIMVQYCLLSNQNGSTIFFGHC